MTSLSNFDLTTALFELLGNGLRAHARGFNIFINDRFYGLYFVKYKQTFTENNDGRWN